MSKLLWQTKQAKTMKNARQLKENMVESCADVLADLENKFAVSLKKWVLKKLANNQAFEHIKNTFEMEMDKEIFKQNNADQGKGNAAKLEYTNYGRNVTGSPFFYSKLFDIESDYS